MRLIFLGCSSSFAVGPKTYHSNMVLKNGNEYFLIDCGGDTRHALHDVGLSYQDITHVYISHLHGDHTHGLEWLGLSWHFEIEDTLPKLFIREDLVDTLWENLLKGSMSTIKGQVSSLSTYFDLNVLKEDEKFRWQGANFELVPVIHYYDNSNLAPCYGLVITTKKQKTFITTDTQFTPELLRPHYEEADMIFHDCETSKKHSGVHAHYNELVSLPAEIKSKMWLYHYNNSDLPDATGDGFAGFVIRGQEFEV
ncbi:MAG: MBL fold metallo-hydrolase [Chlamydiota bacterium]